LKLKKHFILILIIITISSVSACKDDDQALYSRNIVVDGTVLPFYESSLTYNAESEEQIRSQLYSILNAHISKFPGNSSDYIIVNHDGENLTEDFLVDQLPSHMEMQDMIKRIKEDGYLVVNKKHFRVTTIEKEIEALFDGKRQVFPETLDKIIEDNMDAYESKDYEAINQYLRKNNIKVWDVINN